MHKAKCCIITCIDFRLQKAYADFIKSNNWIGVSDIISVAGCSRDLVKPIHESHKEYLLRQIDLSTKLHNPEAIIFLDHQDCGGYAQDGTIAANLPVNDDRQAHVNWGNVAKNIVKEKHPNKNVQVYFVHLDGKVEEIA